ncbi:hypothetical protein BN1708_008331 [Verticillium longisporum]|uniref:Major facilitator superfamily (MFS) profile domain-containing protein n=1 Tax=Verticillium longisporum TaxID=100787 RepID=A0A0G4N2Q3_VERLO|nr:hypothetical protein BN1708_008331 [Verticillium longisporum]
MNALRQRLPAPRQDQAARQARKNGGAEGGKDGYEPSRIAQLAQEAPIWYRSAARRRLYFLLFPAAIVSYATSGYDGSRMNSLQTVSYWDDFFDNPRGAQLGLMSAIMSLGSICSTPIAPWVADKYGRRMGITVGSLIMIIGAILQCESHNFGMFVGSRFVLGFGLSFATTSAPSLVSELSHPKDRVTVTAICNTCWFVGSIAAAWITYGTRNIQSTWSWRLPSLLQMAPSIIQLSTIWFLPESPRWLISNDCGEEAMEALKQYHGEGGETELVRLEFEEIRAAIDHEKRSGTTTWPSMVRTKGNRYRMFLVVCMGFMSQWSGNGLVAYYLSRVMDTVGITDKNTQALVNGLINIWNFGLALTTAFFVERIGRRPLFRASTLGMLTVPIGLENIGWRFYLVYVAILAVESFIAYGWFLETKGKALEEIAVIFDGEAADVRMDEGKKLEGLVDVEETENVHRKV